METGKTGEMETDKWNVEWKAIYDDKASKSKEGRKKICVVKL